MTDRRSAVFLSPILAFLLSCGGGSDRPASSPAASAAKAALPAAAPLPKAPSFATAAPPAIPAPAREGRAPLVFGVYPSDSPTEMVRAFLPLVEYLRRETGLAMELKIAPGYDEAVEGIRRGEFDFFRSGAAFYGTIRLLPNGHKFPLVAMELVRGEKIFHGAIVVPEASAIRTLSDLRGKSMAFGDAKSTMGFLLPSRLLEKAGVPLSALSRYEHLASHDDVALAVAHGQFEAGACKAPTAEKYRSKGLRLLTTDQLVSPSKPVFARPGLDRASLDAVRAALLKLDARVPEDAVVLKGIEKDITGYAEGDPFAYGAFAQIVGPGSGPG